MAIDRATAAAREDGIVSTPTFVYEGGFRLVGAQEYDVFASITRRILQRRTEAGAGQSRAGAGERPRSRLA